jgi:methyl-accepting chemotaxis protein
MRRIAPVALALLAVSLTLVATACGGDDETTAAPVDEWADEFCGAVSSWTGELGAIRDRFDDLSSLDRDSLEEAAQDANDATDRFVNDLQDLPEPDTESGQEIEQSVETLSDTVESEKEDVERAVEGIEDVSDIPGGITAIGSALSSMGTALQTAIDSVENEDVGGELETALDESEACEGIVS